MKTPLMSSSCFTPALMTVLLFVDRCSQLVRCVCVGKTSSQNTSQHITFPRVLISSCVKLLVCTFKYLQPRLCSFVFFMWTERNGSHDFWTLSCPLGEALVFLSPDPVNWCISLVSTQPTSLEAVSSF